MGAYISAVVTLVAVSVAVPSFAAGLPESVTSAATLVTASGAALNGSGNPNGENATGWFRYSTSDPGTCNDSFGNRLPSSSFNDTFLGSGSSPVAYSQSVTGLLPGTGYYYCAIVQNASGTAFGPVFPFSTPPAAPAVTTGASTNRTGTSATLNAITNPGGATTTGWFRYGTTSPGTCNDTFGTRAPASGGSTIPAGTSSVAYSQGITGLTPGTVYYYCAIGQNSVGTALGSVASFTTPLPPTATTSAASSITNSSATLNGQANPNGATTSGWFRYAATNPGVCDDTFGSRAPVAGGSSLGSGSSSQAYSQSIGSLSAGSTYYYCAIASSAEGTAFGAVLSFTTANAPSTTTSAASNVASSSATLNGSGTPNLNGTFGYYRHSTTNPGVCSDAFGTRAPASSLSDTYLGAGSTPVTYSQSITGLTPATTYYFCTISYNTYGTAFGSIISFTTQPAAPAVTTGSSSNRTGTTATLNASANPGGAATTGWFRYSTVSPGTCNDTFGTRAPIAGGSSLGAGTSSVVYSQDISGLTPGTVYYYCAIGQNSVGTTLASVLTFTTPLPPTATTSAASSISNSSAYLNGQGNPNGASTTGWFRYSMSNPVTCSDEFGLRAPATGGTALGSGNSTQGFTQNITGLLAGTTYYYCAITNSTEGTALGAVLSLTTPAVPTTVSSAATLVTSGSATLNGAANPNLDSTYGYYRYSTTDPGSCNDSFGTRLPSASFNDTSLGSGSTSVSYSRVLAGLTPATTYYYCAIGRNAYGTAFGSVTSFTTLAAAPTVTTGTSTNRTGTSATLNASTNPGGATTTGWFRYGTTSPGTCNDTFGTRAPASGGSTIPAGTSSVAYSQGITGLTPGSTYFYCAIGQNSVGTALGNVASFTTPLPPTATTSAASSITNSSATLNGQGNPNGATATGWFRYAATDPGACDDTFGSRAPVAGGSSLGSGSSSQAYSQIIGSLSAGSTYYYCAIASSAEGTAFGTVVSFTTDTSPPSITTGTATNLSSESATLNAVSTPNGLATTGWFRYSTADPGTCDDSFGSRVPLGNDIELGSGTSPVAYSSIISGLSADTTYFYCAIALNSAGMSVGTIRSFHTDVVLTVNISGNGSGAVNSTPNEIACTPACISTKPLGSTLTLTAVPGIDSRFSGWSDACLACGSTLDCLVTFDATKNCTATFELLPLVSIDGDQTPYYDIATALAVPQVPATIRVQAAPDFFETIIMTNPVEILLRGGYSDADFTSQTSYTTISGSLKVRVGTLTVERLKIAP